MGRIWTCRKQRAGEGNCVSKGIVVGKSRCMQRTVGDRSSRVEVRCQGKLKIKVALIL